MRANVGPKFEEAAADAARGRGKQGAKPANEGEERLGERLRRVLQEEFPQPTALEALTAVLRGLNMESQSANFSNCFLQQYNTWAITFPQVQTDLVAMDYLTGA